MWVKICGLTDPAAAAEVGRLGPDAVGLNFYKGSPRSVSAEVAATIVGALPPEMEAVGVFVNHTADAVAAVCRDAGLQTAQIHGDELPEQLQELQSLAPELGIIRAHRMGAEGIGPLAEYLGRCRELGVELTACLVDAKADGVYGGSGKVAPWDVLRTEYARDDWPPLLLAGGLNPENVGAAVRAVHPWGVDVASGVESSPGIKDLKQVEAFIRAARDADA